MTITGKNRTLLEFHKILAPGLKTGGKTESGVKTLSGIPDNVVGPDNVGLNSCKVPDLVAYTRTHTHTQTHTHTHRHTQKQK